LISNANGWPFLAHPADIDNLESFISNLKDAGLVGIEVYYAHYSPDKVDRLSAVAQKFGLITSGGSDYHGLDRYIGADIGTRDIPQESIDQFISLGMQKRTVV
jgi:predicted metal-dependent phosphoesterase TrpH